jgi:leucyl aminopeptidase (aminopeptidase T)
MKIVNYDTTTGKILGWYDNEIHSTIPTPNTEVTDEQWQSAIDMNANYFDGIDFSVKDFRTLDELKQSKINEINNACANQITNGFTSTALDTATPTTYHYQSEQIDQLNLIGLVSGGEDDVFKCSKDDGSGNPTTWNYELHTIAQLTQVLNDGKAYKISLLTKDADLKAQANSIFVSVDGGLDGGYLTDDEAKEALDSILW